MSAPVSAAAAKQRMADDAAQTIRAARRRLEELDTEQRQLQDLISTMERVQSAVGIRVDLREEGVSNGELPRGPVVQRAGAER